LRGHTVVLEFFAIWCPHCQHEAPILNRLTARYGPRGLRVLSILASPYGNAYETTGVTWLADRSDIAWFAKTFHVGHPILIDPHFAVVNRYGVTQYPTIYVLDSKGVIRFVGTGEIRYDAMAAAVQSTGMR
jgi:thiol-disulfide isomerase/thioredoxin